MLKRSLLYLKRKNKRSILLLLLLFAISLGLSVGLSVWNSIDTVTKEVQQQLGTSFVMKRPSLEKDNSEYFRPVSLKNGGTEMVYTGPMLNRDFAEQVMQVDGISAYNGDLDCWVCADDLTLVTGSSNISYYEALTDPHWMESIIANYSHLGGLKKFEVTNKSTELYGYTDTSLCSKFRTGAFELVDGRHIIPEDRQKVLISEQIAELNHLSIGDTIHISLRNYQVSEYEDVTKNLGGIDLEVVGIFHVNGYQPTGEWVQESKITYNWLLTDERSVEFMNNLYDENYYEDFIADFRYANLTFFVDDPSRLNEIVEEVKRLDVEGIGFFDLALDDTMYKSTVDPLNSIRNLITGMMLAIVIGCAIVLLIVFTMWVKSRKQEVAVYLSLGLSKASILGQFLLEAVIVAVIAGAVALPLSQPIANAVGNDMLATTIAEAQPEGPKEYTEEELYEAAHSRRLDELFAYENSTYSGPEHIDFSLGIPQFVLLVILELLIIIGAICKGGSFIVQLEPRQIMTQLR